MTLKNIMHLCKNGQPIYILRGNRVLCAGLLNNVYRYLDGNEMLNITVIAIDAYHPCYKGLCIYLEEN